MVGGGDGIVARRVDTISQRLLGPVPQRAGIGKGHLGVSAEGKSFLLSSEPIGQTPQL